MATLQKWKQYLVGLFLSMFSLGAAAAAPAWVATSIADFETAMTDALGAAASPALKVLALFIIFAIVIRVMRRVSK